jgi:predicted nucleotidyltransferase
VDVAARSGIAVKNVSGKPHKTFIIEAKGGGIGFLDYDGDGDLDAYVANGSSFEGFPQGAAPTNRLYRNQGNGTFTDVTAAAGVGDTSWSMGWVAADYDNDGDVDLYVTNYGANRLYRNEGEKTRHLGSGPWFDDDTSRAGIGEERWSTGAAFGDYDLDGDLDLYVTNYLKFDPDQPPETRSYRRWKDLEVFYGPESYEGEPDVLYHNQGDGTFLTVELPGETAYKGFQPIFVDYDNDGYPDIYVANDTDPNVLYHNLGDGSFEDMSIASGASHSEDGGVQSGMGAAFGDYDNDGDLDIYVTHFSDDYNTLYRNEGARSFLDVSYLAGTAEVSLPFVGWGTAFLDYDNDGDLDLFAANGHVYPAVDDYDFGTSYAQRNLLFENLGDGRFVEVGVQSGSGMAVVKVSRGAAVGDYDEDGDLDILILNVDDTPTLLRNDGGNRQNWLKVSTMGTRSNRDGIGARINVVIGARVQMREIAAGTSFLSNSELRAHFGIGEAKRIDLMEIRWPSGAVQKFADIEANQWLVVAEEEGIIRAVR